MARRSSLIAVRLVCWGLLLAALAGWPRAEADEIGTDAPLPTSLEPPQPLVPKQARGEEDEDRVRALSYFALARQKEVAGESLAALRYYQRAWRYDPTSAAIARRIVPLAFQLERSEEAVRYAIKAVDLGQGDADLLRKLGVYLASQRRWSDALRLYVKALELQAADNQPDPTLPFLRLEIARLSLLTENFPQAADAAAEVIKALEKPDEAGLDERARRILLGEGGSTYELFGAAFLEAGRLDEAEAAFRKSFEQSKDGAVLGYHLARVAFARERFGQALEHLQGYFDGKATGKSLAPYDLLAQILEKQEQSGKLIPRLEEIRAKDPQNVPLMYFLAQRYVAADRLDDAEALLVKVVNTQPGTEAYQALAGVYRRQKKAEPLLSRLAELAALTRSVEPLGPELQALAEDREMLDLLLAEARSQFKEQGPQFDPAKRLAMAQVMLHARRFDEADEFFRSAIEREPAKAEELYRQWGVGMLSADQYDRAIDVLRGALEKKLVAEDNAEFRYFLAMALEFAGKTDEALAVLDEALQINRTPVLESRRPWILYHAKRYQQAADEYRKLIEKYDAQGDSQTRSVMRDAKVILSSVCVILNQWDEAVELLEQVLDEDPDDIGALNDLGYLWTERNQRLYRAYRMTRRAVDAQPDNRAYRDSLGWALYRLGRYEEARQELHKAIEGDENPDGVILDHLGDVYQALKQPDEAVKYWQRAAKRLDASRPDEAARLKQVQEKIAAGGRSASR